MTDQQNTIVRFRSPRPPHGATVELLPSALKYGFKVRNTGTASFLVSRADPNVVNYLSHLLPNEPACVTIERPDGYLPWVGFVTGYTASQADPFATFQCSDHSWRLASPQGARTKKTQVYNTAAGKIIKDVFHDMEDRSEPAPLLKYDAVEDGIAANYEVRTDYALDLLEALAKSTNYEWGFVYNLSGQQAETHLRWTSRLGIDRRDEEVWQEQRHFVKASYTLNYGAGIKAAVAIGGSGSYATRPAIAVSVAGKAPDMDRAYTKTAVSPFGLGGTRILHNQQITDPVVLRIMAAQSHEAPEHAVEQIGITVVEANVDMSRLQLGDIRTIRLATTSLGQSMERVVRIIGISMNADQREHDLELQVLQ